MMLRPPGRSQLLATNQHCLTKRPAPLSQPPPAAQVSAATQRPPSLSGLHRELRVCVPGPQPAADFGFDPLGLCDPEGAGGFITPEWLSYSEVCRCCLFLCSLLWAMGP